MRILAALAALVASVPSVTLSGAQPVRARHAMVVTREPHATGAGIAVLRSGGNAIDAAVAVGFVLAVTHPSAGNLGGGGFMLIRFADGRSTFLDFRECAPLAASRDMYLGPDGKPTRDSLVGYRAAGVPGTVRGFEYAHQKYGAASWAALVAPAIGLAAQGFSVSYGLAKSLKASKVLSQFPESKRIFLKGGEFYEPGDRLVQPELAQTLMRIGGDGSHDFYEGETAHKLADAMAAGGGLITLADLRDYSVIERKPLAGSYRGYQILTAPPPSSGGIGILQMLGMLEGSGYEQTGAGSAAAIHYAVEVMRRYYADRSAYLGDADFANVPVKGLLDPRYIEKRRHSIDREHATPSDQLQPGNPPAEERSETTHYSIVDREGNAVAVTYTLNGSYGCGATAPGLGFLLNNEMDDFAASPGKPNYYGLIQGEANAIQPRKRPLSSMTPTIVARDGRLFLVLGSPGGPRIITTVLEVFLNVVDFGMNVQDAVNWPRFHHQWKPDKIYVEPGFSPDTLSLLRSRGHTIESVASIGEVATVEVNEGWLEGASDPRSEGNASGY